MTKVSPPRNRASIDDLGDGVEVSIPTRRNWLLILFLGAWMCGWFFGETSAISQLMGGEIKNSGSRGFLTFWLVGWTVGGLAAGTAWLWNIAGVERARFRSDGVLVRREVLGIGFTREGLALPSSRHRIARRRDRVRLRELHRAFRHRPRRGRSVADRFTDSQPVSLCAVLTGGTP